jgi:hypothetical protein
MIPVDWIKNDAPKTTARFTASIASAGMENNHIIRTPSPHSGFRFLRKRGKIFSILSYYKIAIPFFIDV